LEVPKLKQNNCCVLIAEYLTGHVCKKDLTIFRNGDNEKDAYQIFDNFTKAKEFVIEFVAAHPEFECVIYDWQGKLLLVYDENGIRNFKLE
jgi:hypothetical protein